MGGSVFSINTNAEVVVISSKEIDVEGNAEN
jgi:hypothetical protein